MIIFSDLQVAGNKAKIDQLADWFAQTVVAGSNLNEKILLVSGPSGRVKNLTHYSCSVECSPPVPKA